MGQDDWGEMYEYKARVTNVVDGDTYDVDIDLGFHIHIHERIRVLDLDTPEKFGDERELGRIVREYAEAMLQGKEVTIRSKQELLPKTDSFGRWLCEVVVDGTSVAERLTELGVNKLGEGYSEQNVRKLAMWGHLWQ